MAVRASLSRAREQFRCSETRFFQPISRTSTFSRFQSISKIERFRTFRYRLKVERIHVCFRIVVQNFQIPPQSISTVFSITSGSQESLTNTIVDTFAPTSFIPPFLPIESHPCSFRTKPYTLFHSRPSTRDLLKKGTFTSVNNRDIQVFPE